MKYLLLLLPLVFSSCSSKKDGPLYLQLHASNKSAHKACLEHQKNVLTKPVTESEVADLDDEQYYFVRDEATALTYINSFDITKFTLKENQAEYEAIVNACVVDKNPEHKTCDTLYPGFKFFRALIHGMNQYQWSPATIKRGKEITVSYIKYVAESESSLMDILFANDLLNRLSNRGYIPKDITPGTVALRRTAEKSYRELMSELRKLGKRELTCDEARKFYARERVKVKELSQSLMSLVVRVQ